MRIAYYAVFLHRIILKLLKLNNRIKSSVACISIHLLISLYFVSFIIFLCYENVSPETFVVMPVVPDILITYLLSGFDCY